MGLLFTSNETNSTRSKILHEANEVESVAEELPYKYVQDPSVGGLWG